MGVGLWYHLVHSAWLNSGMVIFHVMATFKQTGSLQVAMFFLFDWKGVKDRASTLVGLKPPAQPWLVDRGPLSPMLPLQARWLYRPSKGNDNATKGAWNCPMNELILTSSLLFVDSDGSCLIQTKRCRPKFTQSVFVEAKYFKLLKMREILISGNF